MLPSSTGFKDIAYNFLIAHEKVFEGIGWHKRTSSKFGVHALNIAFVGTFLVTSPSEDYLNAARDLIGQGIKEVRRQLNGVVQTLFTWWRDRVCAIFEDVYLLLLLFNVYLSYKYILHSRGGVS